MATTSSFTDRIPNSQDPESDSPHPPPAVGTPGPERLPRSGRLHRPGRFSGRHDYLGAFAVTTGIGCDELCRAVRQAARRSTTRSWPRPWPIDWPKRSPNCCTSRPAATGATARTRQLTSERADRREVSRHPPGARLSFAARPHREADALQPARRRREHRHQADRVVRHVAGRQRLRPVLRPSRRPATSPLDRITRDQVEDYARRKGMPLAEVERWLAPNLGYEP